MTFHKGQKDFRGWIPLYRTNDDGSIEHTPSCHVLDYHGDGERLAKVFAVAVQLLEIAEKVEDFLENQEGIDEDRLALLAEIQAVIKLTT